MELDNRILEKTHVPMLLDLNEEHLFFDNKDYNYNK